MRRNIWHRALSLLAAVMMLAASLPVSAFAQEIPEENPAAIRTGIQPEEEAEAEDVNDLQEDAAPAEAAEPEADEPAPAALPQAAPQPEEPAAAETGSAAQGVAVNGQNFPDAVFRAWILNPANLNGAGQDGTLTEDELQAVTAMDVSNQGIASLKGIEYFTNLESLNCRGNQLTQLDVNANRQLKNLNAKANWLTSLTLRLPLLKGLYVGENQLTTLDVTGCPSLIDLNFERNMITQIDISGNPELIQLYSRSNLLTSLDLSHNTKLVFIETFDNKLTEIDVSMLSELRFLHIDHNRLTTLDMSHNPKLEDSGFVGRNNDLRTLILPNVPGLKVDTEDFLEQDPIVGSERSEWFYDSQFTQPIREEYIPGNGQTVYARRVPNRYTVRFSANGGAGSMDSLNSEYGQQFQLPAARFTRTGYTFTGWNTWTNGTGTAYADGQQVSNLGGEKWDGDKVDLYAQWRPNAYTIQYQARGSEGSMQPTQAVYNADVKLADCQFHRPSEVFAGWSTRPDGPVEYQNGQTVRNLTAEDGGVVNLYAVWKGDSAMEQLSQTFAGYDPQNYIGEDWDALEAAYEAGRAGIEAAAGTAEKQAALEKAQSAMAQIPAKQTRADEIINAWETEFSQILALSATQIPPEQSADMALRARQAVEKARPEALAVYSSLTTPEGRAEAAALAQPALDFQVNALTDFAAAMDWLDGVKELYAMEPAQVTSAQAGQLARALEEYQTLAAQSSIQPAILQRLTAHRALAEAKQQAVEQLETRYQELAQAGKSQQLKAALEEGKTKIEAAATSDAVSESLAQAVKQLEAAKPNPTQTPQPTATPNPTQTPQPTATPNPTATPQPTQTPNPTATPEPTQAPSSTAAPQPTRKPETPSAQQAPQPTQAPATVPAANQSGTQQAVIRPSKPRAEQPAQSPEPTQAPQPTQTPQPTAVPEEQPEPTAAPENSEATAPAAKTGKPLPLLIAAGVAAVAAVAALIWKLTRKKQ